jgi:hypothetical protein
VVAVLLVALWVRSYSWTDAVYIHSAYNSSLKVASLDGQFLIRLTGAPGSLWSLKSSRNSGSGSAAYVDEENGMKRVRQGQWFTLMWANTDPTLFAPQWFPIALLTMLAFVPWLRWRFSLRTLLIATTLVAVALGLIVWLR